MKNGVIILAALMAGNLIHVPAAAAQSVEDRIQDIETKLQAAFSEDLQLISPGHYQEAAARLAEAQRRLGQAGRIQDIDRALARARTELGEAEKLKRIGSVLLEAPLARRTLALTANAPQFAAREWDTAERKMRDAGEEIEDGDQNGARRRAAEATNLYGIAEYQAIREDLIGRARRLGEQARRADADDRARVTLRMGDSLLAAAESILAEDRSQRAVAGSTARAAAESYGSALWITRRSDEIADDTDARIEDLILEHQHQLRELTSLLGFDPSFTEGSRPVADRLVTSVQSLQEERDQLREDLADREMRLAEARSGAETLAVQLEVQRDSLGALLAAETAVLASQAADEARQRRQAAAALRAQAERQETIERSRARFTSEEAEVFVQGNELVIRMKGLNFPVGSAEITPENFSLLTQLQRTMREFPGATVRVTGHTDSQGNEAYNQSLSERRAQAVAAYLIANTNWTEEQISAVGFGEAQPLASNESTAGRAQNRRIDVTIPMPAIETQPETESLR